MKIKRFICLIVSLVVLIAFSIDSRAKENPFPTPTKIRCTCYIVQGQTASGQHTREGIIAGKKEWLGRCAILYAINTDGSIGDLIGIYEFLDTGAGIDTDGDGKGDSIKKGLSVDVWQPSMDAAKEWIRTYGDYVYIQVVESEG